MSQEFRSLDATPRFFSDRNVLTRQSFLNGLKFRLFITILSLGVQWKVVRRSLRMAVFADHPFRRKEPVVEDISQECFELRVLCFDDLNG
jgi:hypothetical protein